MKITNFWKKAISLTAALALLAGLVIATGITASAEGEGKITVHKYARPTAGIVTDNTYTGDEITDSTLLDSLGKPLQGAGFTLYKLATADLDEAIANGNKYVDYSIDIDSNIVTFRLDGAGEPSVPFVEAAPTAVGGGQQLTNNNGVTVFADLEDAYYLLVETLTPDGYTACEKSIIRIPLTQGDGEAHNRDIHVYPKNVSSTPPVRKELAEKPVILSAGDDITFNIIADFRNTDTVNPVANVNDMKDGSKYGQAFVIDEIQEYFKYVSVDSVTLLNAAGNTVGAPLDLGTDYTVNDSNLVAPGNGSLIVELEAPGIDKAIAAGAASYVVQITLQYLGAQGYTSTMPAVVKNVAKSLIAGPDAETVDPKDPEIPEIPKAETYVPTTQIIINKKNSDLANFAGARFRLALVPNPDPDNKDHYVKNISGGIIELTTTADGILVFNGVDYDDTGTTYYLQELSTVGGYQIKVGTIALTLPAKNDPANKDLLVNGEWKQNAVVTTSTTVINYRNDETDPDEPTFALPLTGSTGTIILSVVGGLIMLGAVIWFIRRKKKDNT
ncbi:MAG: SpaH/EbpB family LPXTG-anchored major pilin [Oscillospiraceae bacterium]|nr:SpaH/EbpB family LPXTG-anchored major pilin [Oscillospiraceae bacterium]